MTLTMRPSASSGKIAMDLVLVRGNVSPSEGKRATQAAASSIHSVSRVRKTCAIGCSLSTAMEKNFSSAPDRITLRAQNFESARIVDDIGRHQHAPARSHSARDAFDSNGGCLFGLARAQQIERNLLQVLRAHRRIFGLVEQTGDRGIGLFLRGQIEQKHQRGGAFGQSYLRDFDARREKLSRLASGRGSDKSTARDRWWLDCAHALRFARALRAPRNR